MKKEPDATNTNLVEISTLLSGFQPVSERGDAKEIEAHAINFMTQISQKAQMDEYASIQLLSDAENALVERDWITAESLFKQRLVLPEVLKNPALEYKAHSELSGFYTYTGDYIRALEESEIGLELARKSPMFQVLGMALVDVIQCYLRLNRPTEALGYANEFLNGLAVRKMTDIELGRGSILRAKCYALLGETVKAEQDMEAGWFALSPMVNSKTMTGYQSGLALYWEVKAMLLQLENDQTGVIEAYKKAVEHCVTVTQ